MPFVRVPFSSAWSKTKDRRRDYHGFISVELTALAVLGRDRGLAIEVESPYLPVHLVPD